MLRAACVLLVLITALGCTATKREADPEPGSLSPGTGDPIEMTELSSSELQAVWWTWAETAPVEQNPVDDTTGEHCAVGQPDGLWLLAGTFGGSASRRCELPAERPIFAPAINLITPVSADCDAFMKDAEGRVSIDKEAVKLERLAPVSIDIDTRDGPATGFACGLWARVPALDEGTHNLLIQGSSGTFRTRVKYELVVVS